MTAGRVLSHEEARRFYDRFGRRQDLQRFYEDPALDALLRHAGFQTARSVVELGCGTGRLAARLLREFLPHEATYAGFDISETMVRLARARISAWRDRATVERIGGAPSLSLPPGSCDRFLSAYVLDLLSMEDIEALLAEARRILAPDGRLCLVSLTFGTTTPTRWISGLWTGLHRASPGLVGGCRPIDLRVHLVPWCEILHREVVCPFGVCSEVVVAQAHDRASVPGHV